VVACNAVSQDTTTVSVLGARPTPSTTGGSQPLSSGEHSIVQPSSVSSDTTFLTFGSTSSDSTLCPSSGLMSAVSTGPLKRKLLYVHRRPMVCHVMRNVDVAIAII